MGWQPETQPKGKPPVEKTEGAETMQRLIDADAVEKVLKEKHFNRVLDSDRWVIADIKKGIMDLPTIDAEPVRHGKWITEECLPGVAVCSICGHEIRGIGCQYTKYCDECGARMDVE